MEPEIKALRNKLPTRGYVQLIMDSVPKNADKALVTKDIIKHFFLGRAVKYEAKVIVIKSVNQAIKKLSKKQSVLKKMIAAR